MLFISPPSAFSTNPTPIESLSSLQSNVFDATPRDWFETNTLGIKKVTLRAVAETSYPDALWASVENGNLVGAVETMGRRTGHYYEISLLRA